MGDQCSVTKIFLAIEDDAQSKANDVKNKKNWRTAWRNKKTIKNAYKI